VTKVDAVFIRWIRCEHGHGFPAVARDVGYYGLDIGLADDLYETGRELCRQAAPFFGERIADPVWHNDDGQVEWTSGELDIIERFKVGLGFDVGPSLTPDPPGLISED